MPMDLQSTRLKIEEERLRQRSNPKANEGVWARESWKHLCNIIFNQIMKTFYLLLFFILYFLCYFFLLDSIDAIFISALTSPFDRQKRVRVCCTFFSTLFIRFCACQCMWVGLVGICKKNPVDRGEPEEICAAVHWQSSHIFLFMSFVPLCGLIWSIELVSGPEP